MPLLAFWLGPKGGKWLCLSPYINAHPILVLFCMFRPTGSSERLKNADFGSFGALCGPLGLLLAFWLGPKGGRWLCQTPFINTQSILVVCGQFRPTGDVRKVKKLIFAVFCAFWSPLEPLLAFWLGPKGLIA